MKRALVTALALVALVASVSAIPDFTAVQLAGGTAGTPGGENPYISRRPTGQPAWKKVRMGNPGIKSPAS